MQKTWLWMSTNKYRGKKKTSYNKNISYVKIHYKWHFCLISLYFRFFAQLSVCHYNRFSQWHQGKRNNFGSFVSFVLKTQQSCSILSSLLTVLGSTQISLKVNQSFKVYFLIILYRLYAESLEKTWLLHSCPLSGGVHTNSIIIKIVTSREKVSSDFPLHNRTFRSCSHSEPFSCGSVTLLPHASQ